jgi:hypothetical protein
MEPDLTQPDRPRQKIHFGVPADYWEWSEEQQLQWARQVATSLQARLVRSTPDPERRRHEEPERQ